MSDIINISATDNFTDFIAERIFKSDKKTAIICGGRRPFLFVKRSLAKKRKKPSYPPDCFTNDEFIEKIVFQNSSYFKIPDIEAAYILYEIIANISPHLLNGQKSFASYLSWLSEILAFIEHLDMDNTQKDALENLKKNAEIGYDVPQNINELLKNIFDIRSIFHKKLIEINALTKGLSYIQASKIDLSFLTQDYEEIILAAPFYLYKSEINIFKKIFNDNILTILISGDVKNYEPLKKIYSVFGKSLPKSQNAIMADNSVDFEVFAAYDEQTQCLIAKNILKNFSKENLDKTLIVIPNADFFAPIVLEISQLDCPYNISLGYPVSKTALFSLVKSIFEAQMSRKGKSYYVKDIIKVLANPLIKNTSFFKNQTPIREIIYSIEKSFLPDSDSKLSGKLFVEIEDILSDEIIFKDALDGNDLQEIKEDLYSILQTLFSNWQEANCLSDFADILLSFIDKILTLSSAGAYHLNKEAAQILISAASQMKFGEASKIHISQEDILNIWIDFISAKRISLAGTPLSGLQILGFLESRNLYFENVLILGMSDSNFPSSSKISPLIPKEISYILGAEFERNETEIQKYYFDCLISGAKKVYLLYSDNEEEPRSRFIEELIWKKQKKTGDINSVLVKNLIIKNPSLEQNLKKKYEKTSEIKSFLNNMTYSHSSIDLYLSCRLKFYFAYVLRLVETEEIGYEADGREIGNFLHKYFQNILKEGLKAEFVKKDEFIENAKIELSKSFDGDLSFRFREDAFMTKKILEHRIKNFWEMEKQRDFLQIFACEKKYASEIEIDGEKFNLQCKIDRIDETRDGFILIDYKTGEPPKFHPNNFQKLTENVSFERIFIKNAADSYQLPLYKYIFEKSENKKTSFCAFYDIRNSTMEDFFKSSKDIERDYDICIEIIKKTIAEINSGDYFEFDNNDIDSCRNCRFFYICR